jgi:hypothetical protein
MDTSIELSDIGLSHCILLLAGKRKDDRLVSEFQMCGRILKSRTSFLERAKSSSKLIIIGKDPDTPFLRFSGGVADLL